jgi:hypothetical protein
MADGSAPKKANLLIALGGLKKKPGALGEAEPDADDMGTEEAPPAMGEVKAMAAGDVMAAFKSGDATALEDALTRFVEACSSEGYAK